MDLYGREDRNWPIRKVEVVDIDDLKYSVVQQTARPALTLSLDYCNTMDAEGEFTFEKTSETASTCAWEVTEGIEMESAIELSVGIPDLAEVKMEEKLTLSFSHTTR